MREALGGKAAGRSDWSLVNSDYELGPIEDDDFCKRAYYYS